MTPAEVAAHPSVIAVRSTEFDFRPTLRLWATCAACGRTGVARSGEDAGSPCGHPGACGFHLAAPQDSPDGPAVQWDRTELRGAIEERPMGGSVPRRFVLPPPPPRQRAEWRARHDAVRVLAPALSAAWCGLPIGWTGLVELAAHALDARGLGHALRVRQAKEKFGTARIYTAPADGAAASAYGRAAQIMAWAVMVSDSTCARDGTGDGRLGQVGSWWLTLGEHAWHDVADVRGRRDDWRSEVLNIYPDWARLHS